ncbi:MAG: threonylcarbamoyl-AMP synthase [Gemmatimonadetes bacterium]|nr:threonylcarbamoyl-AMP synthase [Gemmatimonadota bacterium]
MTAPHLLPFGGRGWKKKHLGAIVEHLRAGGLVAYPTETVYGFGSTLAESAIARLTAFKGRDPGKPFLVLLTDEEMAPGLRWTQAARRLAGAFWPGPLTLVLAAPEGAYPAGVRDARGGVAVRATPQREVRALLEALRAPITSTSANLPGGPPALSAREAAAAVAALGGDDEVWVLDGGSLPRSPPSTIVDCTEGRPRVTRTGALPVERIRRVIAEIDERDHG